MATKTAKRKLQKAVAPISPPTLQSVFPTFRKSSYRQRTNAARDDFIDELRMAYARRGIVLYLGSGVSRSLGVPTWAELIRTLTVRMMTLRLNRALKNPAGEIDAKALAALTGEVRRTGTEYEKPVLMVARAIKDEFGEELPYRLAVALYRTRLRRLQPTPRRGERRPLITFGKTIAETSPLLESIVSVTRARRDSAGVQAIVNYNFDDILDRQLRDNDVPCTTVLSGRDRIHEGCVPCYHVHGILPRDEIYRGLRARTQGNFVFSEDEYHAEYTEAYRWSNLTQMSLLGRHTGLFVGLSMEDPNIRRLIDVTHRQYPDVVNYAILTRERSLARRPDNGTTVLNNIFEEVETTTFHKIGVRVLWADSHDEVPILVRRVGLPDE